MAAFIHHIVMQQRRGVDELDRGRQMDVIGPVIAAKSCRRERQQRPKPLAPGLDQMCRDLRDAWRVFRGHTLADHQIDRLHIGGQPCAQPIVRFLRCLIQPHVPPSLRSRQSLRLPTCVFI